MRDCKITWGRGRHEDLSKESRRLGHASDLGCVGDNDSNEGITGIQGAENGPVVEATRPIFLLIKEI